MATHSVTTKTFDKECCKRSLCVSLFPPPSPWLRCYGLYDDGNRSSPRLVHHEILATPHFRFTVWGDSLYLQLLQTVLLPTYALVWRRLVRSPTQLVCFGLIIKFGWPPFPRRRFQISPINPSLFLAYNADSRHSPRVLSVHLPPSAFCSELLLCRIGPGTHRYHAAMVGFAISIPTSLISSSPKCACQASNSFRFRHSHE